mgnify:CR=1 FL=1
MPQTVFGNFFRTRSRGECERPKFTGFPTGRISGYQGSIGGWNGRICSQRTNWSARPFCNASAKCRSPPFGIDHYHFASLVFGGSRARRSRACSCGHRGQLRYVQRARLQLLSVVQCFPLNPVCRASAAEVSKQAVQPEGVAPSNSV